MAEPRPDYAIDIEKVIAAKFPGKKIPKWFTSCLKRFIHQDFLNAFLVKGYEEVEFCTKAMEYLNIKLEVHGLEKLKLPEGALISFASNHPLGGADGVSLVSVVGQHFGGNIRLFVNDFLLALKGLSKLCIPVSKTGSQARDLPAKVAESYGSSNNIIIFPAGLCSRKIGRNIQDLAWSKNFIKMSRNTSRYIVPIHFVGQNSKRFYRIAKLCKLLKSKFNFAMLFLPDELYRAQGSTFKIIFGEPIPPQELDNSKTDREWAAEIRKKVYEL